VTLPKLSPASSQYGASMGRSDTVGEYSLAHSFKVQKLAWIDGDYDTGGAYWGHTAGESIFRFYADGFDGDPVEHFVRANSAQSAIKVIDDQYTLSSFQILPDELDESTPEGKLYWSSFNRLELQMTLEDAESMSHSGQCDVDVAIGRHKAYIAKQLDAIGQNELFRELLDYGFDEESLEDHSANLTRLLWLAANDIVENQNEEEVAE